MVQAYLKEMIIKFIKYGAIGSFNTSVTIFLMVLLAHIGFNYVTYTAIAYIIAFIVGFTLHFHFTFHVVDFFFKRLQFFLFISIINLCLVELLQILMIDWFKLSTVFAVTLGMGIYASLGFYLNYRFVYAETKKL